MDLPATAAARIDLSTDRLIVVAAGWLGIMVGSRLYFRLVGEVLTDDARYEAVMDDVVQEVRRRAPSASAGRAINVNKAHVPQQAAPVAARAVDSPSPPAGAAGASVVLTVHNSNHITNSSNFGNTDNSNNTVLLL